MLDINKGATHVIETIDSDPATRAAAGSGARVNRESEGAERRRHSRYAFTATVEALETKSRTRLVGRTADLSEGGCYIDTISPFPVETTVKLHITDEHRSTEIPAKVVYALPGMGMGVMFLFNAQEQIDIVEQWIAELSGEAQPETEAPAAVQANRVEEAPSDNAQLVLQELIIELMRQRVITNAAGKSLIQKLLE